MSDPTHAAKLDQFRRLMPRQFTKLTKLCATCGARVRWDETARCNVCPRCKRSY